MKRMQRTAAALLLVVVISAGLATSAWAQVEEPPLPPGELLPPEPPGEPVAEEVPTCDGKPATHWDDDGDGEIRGTAGNDVIAGDDNPNIIHGNGGDDFICGKGGNDTIDGGPGDDDIFGGDHDDKISGGDGLDWIFGEDGNDVLRQDGPSSPGGSAGEGGYVTYMDGGDGNDKLFGSNRSDLILGGDGVDDIEGYGGKDWLEGGAGDDKIHAGTGDDDAFGKHFYSHADRYKAPGGPSSLEPLCTGRKRSAATDVDIVEGGPGSDRLRGGPHTDCLYGFTIPYSTPTAAPVPFTPLSGKKDVPGIIVSAPAAPVPMTPPPSKKDVPSVLVPAPAAPVVDAEKGGDHLNGDDGDDVLYGHNTAKGDCLAGGTGNDWLYGLLGPDLLLGQDGRDYLDGGAPEVDRHDQAGADRLAPGSDNDVQADPKTARCAEPPRQRPEPS